MIPHSGSTEESPKNTLPQAPDTGSLEEDFSAGGTRENHLLAKVCGASRNWQKIYDRLVEMPEGEGPIAIAIPPEPQYTLSVKVNYSWSLLVDCGEANNGSVIALEGWLYRLPLNADLQNKLAAASDEDKYKVYLENDLQRFSNR